MKYVLTIGELPETAKLALSPSGGPIIFHSEEEASDSAKTLASLMYDRHPDWSVFVVPLRPSKCFMPLPGGVTDEIVPEGESPFKEENHDPESN